MLFLCVWWVYCFTGFKFTLVFWFWVFCGFLVCSTCCLDFVAVCCWFLTWCFVLVSCCLVFCLYLGFWWWGLDCVFLFSLFVCLWWLLFGWVLRLCVYFVGNFVSMFFWGLYNMDLGCLKIVFALVILVVWVYFRCVFVAFLFAVVFVYYFIVLCLWLIWLPGLEWILLL